MIIDPFIDIGSSQTKFRAVVLLAHPELYVSLTEDSVVVDPWREHQSDHYDVIHYGDTRNVL